MTQAASVTTALHELISRTGTMRELGSENGRPMLDWVDAVGRLMAKPDALEGVEAEARELWDRGIRHVIWAGMGRVGSRSIRWIAPTRWL